MLKRSWKGSDKDSLKGFLHSLQKETLKATLKQTLRGFDSHTTKQLGLHD